MEENKTASFPPVYVTPCGDYAPESAQRAIAALAERCRPLRDLKSGTRVVIKANLVTFLKPEKAATTHPALLKALVDYIESRGASAVIGDSPGGPYTKAYLESVYSATGMHTAGAVNEDFSVATAHFPEAAVAREFDYTAYLDKADIIINFCKLKTHGMMGMSCAVKNMFGAIPGLTKPAYHYRFPDYGRFADMLIDLNEYFRPALSIVDAVTGMEGNGPTMGTPRHIGAVLASESPYPLDLVCAKLIGLGAEEVPTLAAATRRGLAPERAEDVTVCGDVSPFAVPDFNTASADGDLELFVSGWGPAGKLLNGAAKRILAVRPILTPAKCVGCGKCAGLCPAKAIRMKQKRPSIDRKTCIRCFCCQEFCPVGALEARRSRLGALILKKKT